MEVIATLKDLLGKTYEQFGHSDTTVFISQYLDELVVEEQQRRLKEWLKQ